MFKIAKSLFAIVAVAAIAAGSTSAYFSDTEQVAGNTFAAGGLDLQLAPGTPMPFSVSDLVPGDSGTGKISLTNATDSIDGVLDVKLANFVQYENGILEPEINDHGPSQTGDYEAGPNAGELNFFLKVAMFIDADQDGTFDAGDWQLAYDGQKAIYPGFWGGDFHYSSVSSMLTGWNDIMTMTDGQSVDLVMMWQFPTESTDANYSQNIAMTDGLSFDTLTSLEQVDGSGGVAE